MAWRYSTPVVDMEEYTGHPTRLVTYATVLVQDQSVLDQIMLGQINLVRSIEKLELLITKERERGTAYNLDKDYVDIVAGEIINWLLGHKHTAGGDAGGILFNKKFQKEVSAGAEAMNMETRHFMSFGRKVINARNDAAHFDTLDQLDNAVAGAREAFAAHPSLKRSAKNAWRTIQSYESFKAALPYQFV